MLNAGALQVVPPAGYAMHNLTPGWVISIAVAFFQVLSLRLRPGTCVASDF